RDRELRAAEAEDEERDGKRDRAAKERGHDHRPVRAHAVVAEPDGAVRTESDEALLSDRDEPAVAGERVPHRGHQHEDQQRRHLLGGGLAQRHRHEHEHDRKQAEAGREPRGEGAPTLHGEGLGHVAALGRKMPPCGEASTARNTRCPASTEYCGLICAPTVWATPSTMPPASVPQSEPKPPITTASNAKISCVGPENGSKVERIARNIPATAAVATATAVAR